MWKLWAVSDITVLPWAPPAFLQWDRDQVGGHGEKWIITGERMNISLFFFFFLSKQAVVCTEASGLGEDECDSLLQD